MAAEGSRVLDAAAGRQLRAAKETEAAPRTVAVPLCDALEERARHATAQHVICIYDQDLAGGVEATRCKWLRAQAVDAAGAALRGAVRGDGAAAGGTGHAGGGGATAAPPHLQVVARPVNGGQAQARCCCALLGRRGAADHGCAAATRRHVRRPRAPGSCARGAAEAPLLRGEHGARLLVADRWQDCGASGARGLAWPRRQSTLRFDLGLSDAGSTVYVTVVK